MIPDDKIDDISIDPIRTQDPIRGLGRIRGDDSVSVVTSTLDFFGWSRLPLVVDGVADRQGIGTDRVGFRFPTDDDLDPGEEFEGVEIYNPLGTVHVSLDAFERLMVRFFHALILGAEAYDEPITRTPWWQTFKEQTARVAKRAHDA